MAAPQMSHALLILFNGFNTLDANGPLEVLRKSGMSKFFKVTIASETPTATSVEGAIMQRHISLDQKLIDSLEDYDILVIPGGGAEGPESTIQKIANDTKSPFMRLIDRFANLHPRSESLPRILLTVCTGAIFLAKLGILNNGRFCTTHWAFYTTLVSFVDAAARAAGGNTTPGVVIPARYVDSGLNANQVRIITSGGISSGIDGSLHVVRLRQGEDEARSTAELLDYAWRKTDGVSFDSDFAPISLV